MNPKCYRCEKTVYPVEKLNCLDKIWHKGCFNCEVCHMTLSMKTYQGYEKLPYCNTHYPSTKFTAVADTPENLRIKKNTTNQSTIVYHKEFEQEKGKYTAVADDPETTRVKKTQNQASSVKYQQRIEPLAAQVDSEGSRPPASNTSSRKVSEPAAPPPSSGGPKYIALYDYTAADDDEVSFQEGDIIINGEIIDDGWMSGTVKRTGQTGMLPSNYVEPQ
ncbi:LIM and SH3 domain protein 1 [Hydra vulgaris]|uniref:LIM and SH3 domain protein 1 n=1 Tax=Hydra vulgaris TaxID=6087 RepID=T2MDN9_HYDVU|nr:LIM and SH3 domain protein 1 [Hydra vulgaris]